MPHYHTGCVAYIIVSCTLRKLYKFPTTGGGRSGALSLPDGTGARTIGGMQKVVFPSMQCDTQQSKATLLAGAIAPSLDPGYFPTPAASLKETSSSALPSALAQLLPLGQSAGRAESEGGVSCWPHPPVFSHLCPPQGIPCPKLIQKADKTTGNEGVESKACRFERGCWLVR